MRCTLRLVECDLRHLSYLSTGSPWCWCGSGLQVYGQQWAVCLSLWWRCCQPGMVQKTLRFKSSNILLDKFSSLLLYFCLRRPVAELCVLCVFHRVRFLKRTTWQRFGSCPPSLSVRTTGTAWERQWSELLPAPTTTREETSFPVCGYSSHVNY